MKNGSESPRYVARYLVLVLLLVITALGGLFVYSTRRANAKESELKKEITSLKTTVATSKSEAKTFEIAQINATVKMVNFLNKNQMAFIPSNHDGYMRLDLVKNNGNYIIKDGQVVFMTDEDINNGALAEPQPVDVVVK